MNPHTAPPTAERPLIAELAGLWLRELLTDIDGSIDTQTAVGWLQGPEAFVDLRQPIGRPDFTGTHCDADVTEAQRSWMASQAGFAGRLVAGGEFFEWRREIDLQPRHITPDAGTLYYQGEILIEKGWYESYVEHWRRQPQTPGPSWAVHLGDEQGSHGLLVRVGSRFGWARRRAEAGDHAGPVDVEIALGRIVPGRRSRSKAPHHRETLAPKWLIERSSLPYREGCDLGLIPAGVSPGVTASPGSTVSPGATLSTSDISVTGIKIRLEWTVAQTEGDVSL